MKEIQLTNGYKAIVDDEDFDYLSKFKWYAHFNQYGKIYARRAKNQKGKGKWAWMHRVIMNPPAGALIDHINGNGLDNRRSNLRTCTHAENLRNRKAPRNNTSGYRGVVWNSISKNWVAQIESSGKSIYIGRFDDIVEAAIAYDEKARELWGEFYSMPNIIQLDYVYTI